MLQFIKICHNYIKIMFPFLSLQHLTVMFVDFIQAENHIKVAITGIHIL